MASEPHRRPAYLMSSKAARTTLILLAVALVVLGIMIAQNGSVKLRPASGIAAAMTAASSEPAPVRGAAQR